MDDCFSHFLKDMAARLLELADRAPDIGTELRKFADDLIGIADEAEERKYRSSPDLQD
jgi:hypothetical protein